MATRCRHLAPFRLDRAIMRLHPDVRTTMKTWWLYGIRYAAAPARRCCACGAWLSLGPSTENERSELEARAAELAAAWTPDGVTISGSDGEFRGWNGWPYMQPIRDDHWIGFLAAQIQNHERDLGSVNWAGHHMADYAINPDGTLPQQP